MKSAVRVPAALPARTSAAESPIMMAACGAQSLLAAVLDDVARQRKQLGGSKRLLQPAIDLDFQLDRRADAEISRNVGPISEEAPPQHFFIGQRHAEPAQRNVIR